MVNPPLDHDAPTVRKPLLTTSFTLADLNRVRREVEAASRRCGLDHDEIENWVIAVNELMINVVRARGRQR
ncbi:ATP-binding protein [Micromonospora arida]|uniref:ATP-binding protein n=1 Tax=Micromonospora arida TaxID=2203715 RepID=UPI003CEDD7D9